MMININKKTIIILIIIFVLILLFFFGIKFLAKLTQEKMPEEKIIEKPKSLTVEELKEKLLKDAKPDPPGPDLLVIESEKEGASGNPRFVIQYQKLFDLFLISILDKPLVKVRQEAEERLLEKAGGAKELDALCRLNVLVGSPYFVSQGEVIENPEVLEICLGKDNLE